VYATTALQMQGLVRPVQLYEMASLATDLYNFYFLRLLMRLVGKQGKYVGRRKNIMKKKNWRIYKRNIK
jgi:predicted CDP-diglyceride synthetase/phosphatidate cytidylyltransferase